MFETGEPHTGAELRGAFGTLVAQGSSLLAPWPDAVFFAPQGTNWSPADHLRHLRKSTAPLVTALRFPRAFLALRFGTHDGPSRNFAQVRSTYLAALEGGAQAGRFAPRPRTPGADPAARRLEIMAGWTGAVVALTNEIARWPEKPLDRYRLPHPLLGPLTVREMLALSVYHTAHHLRRVAERAGIGVEAR